MVSMLRGILAAALLIVAFGGLILAVLAVITRVIE